MLNDGEKYCMRISSMRIMERAVYALGEKIGATVIDRNNVNLDWGIILANINGKMRENAEG